MSAAQLKVWRAHKCVRLLAPAHHPASSMLLVPSCDTQHHATLNIMCYWVLCMTQHRTPYTRHSCRFDILRIEEIGSVAPLRAVVVSGWPLDSSSFRGLCALL
eukprot:133831-Chlamydomonas_euryale.AAC.1